MGTYNWSVIYLSTLMVQRLTTFVNWYKSSSTILKKISYDSAFTVSTTPITIKTTTSVNAFKSSSYSIDSEFYVSKTPVTERSFDFCKLILNRALTQWKW